MNRKRKPSIECRFYRTASGEEPVREWLRAIPVEARKEIGSDIQVVQWRWPIGRPLVGSLGDGLFEVRSSIGRTIYRVLFCFDHETIMLLHGFQKKTRKTPAIDLALARQRKRSLGR